jgi:hypothetical protein
VSLVQNYLLFFSLVRCFFVNELQATFVCKCMTTGQPRHGSNLLDDEVFDGVSWESPHRATSGGPTKGKS